MFILAMTALFVLLTLSAISLEVATQSIARAERKRASSVAQDLAEAAADRAEAWLRAQGYPPPSGSDPIDPLGGLKTVSTGTYRAVVLPAPGNAMAWRRSYTIIGTGTSKLHHATSTVRMLVREQSFALYAYFTDQEVSSITSGTIWFMSADQLHGPVHSNDQFHVNWDQYDTTPIFYGTVSSHAQSVQWNPAKPATVSQWKKVLQGGEDALTLGADYIALPEQSNLQQLAAWGADTGFPTASGVYLPVIGGQVDAGIYIAGDSTVTFAPNGTAGQTVSIIQGDTRTDVSTDLAGNTTVVAVYTMVSGTWVPQSTTQYAGLPNGVIYSTGNITSLSGTLADSREDGTRVVTRNAWTVCTDLASEKDITITGDLKYATPPNPDQPLTFIDNLKAACLGLVARNIIVKTDANSVRIDGTVLANSSFYNYYWNSGVPKGALTVSGGIIQRKRGPVGQFSGSSIISGYSKDYHYDPRMADYPPPFFPTTGQYDVVSWQYE